MDLASLLKTLEVRLKVPFEIWMLVLALFYERDAVTNAKSVL